MFYLLGSVGLGEQMEILKKGNEIIVKHILKKNEMYRISEGRHFKTISFFKRTQICMGYSSKTEDNKHIILADYDHADKNTVINEIRTLQKLFSLPPAYLLTTKEKDENGAVVGNYHTILLSKHTSRDVFDMLGNLSIDDNFRDSPLRKLSKSWVLRLSEKKGSGKIKFLEIIGNGNLDGETSTAHKKLLTKFFPEIKHPKYLNEDNLKEVRLQEYETKG